ncbi:hypothetical protein QBC35DRAFT_41676 [Podospora australis]|uniref:AA1-like domain-containing protein n=1 Tax=Podospora australis TaxID=1536484 RepID=A0AAN6WMM1_9PEZI|nr:hypothetical protein QBC35DRAFT_41676 [Podospora australis]
MAHQSKPRLTTILTTILTLPLLTTASPLFRNLSRQGQTCTQNSFHGLKWTVSNFLFTSSLTFASEKESDVTQGLASVSFNLTNSAIPSQLVNCYATSDKLTDFFYGDQLFQCQPPPEIEPTTNQLAEQSASFKFDRKTGTISLELDWSCHDGADARWPTTTFSAGGSTTVSLGSCTKLDQKNPNWSSATKDQAYKTQHVDCAPLTFEVNPDEIESVA